MGKDITEESEVRRLNKVYKNLPANKRAIGQGLIAEAARLRVLLNQLWADVQENGLTEKFQQGEEQEPYERERPAARQYFQANKSYQTIIKQLNDLVPQDAPGQKDSKLGKLMAELKRDA